jgi:hypothetical protein
LEWQAAIQENKPMTRLDEINHKHQQIRALLDQWQVEALWLRCTRNIAWFTAGADASIAINRDFGAYSLLITREQRLIYTTNIEAVRLRAEDRFHDDGFEYVEYPWHAPQHPIADGPLIRDEDMFEAALQRLRSKLTIWEQERYRELGRDTAEAVEEATRAVRPGDTEFDIAARLDAACRERGGAAVVNLVATDERISQFRHPLPTNKRLERLAMVVVCMRRGGLIAAATRLAYLGKLPDSLKDKLQRIATVDAAAQQHHQGGLIAYNSRERLALPGDTTMIEAGQAFAWNPSLVGCKSEETFLLTESGANVLTHTGQWPMITVESNGEPIVRSAILEIA